MWPADKLNKEFSLHKLLGEGLSDLRIICLLLRNHSFVPAQSSFIFIHYFNKYLMNAFCVLVRNLHPMKLIF